MRVLHRKLFRDLKANVTTLAVVVVIIAIGTGTLIGLGAAQRILKASQSSYYREYRFADFWIDVKKAPLSVLPRIAKLPGVESVEARVLFDVILDLSDEIRPLTGRLISLPPRRFDRTINGICLIRGSGFSDDRDEEVILSEAFAQAHHLEIGDRVQVILNRKRESFTIVGTAISPEYVYMVRGPGDLVPDAKHFGVLYVKQDYAREVLDFQDAFNQVVGQLVPDADVDSDLLLDRIDRLLSSYGVLEKTPRRRQASHRFLSDEIHGLSITATIMPAIFLGVAALVLNILMIRLVQRQRTTIGTLKALGYSDRDVMTHYLLFGVGVGIAGGIAGSVLGLMTTYGMIEMYKSFFQFPHFSVRTYPDLLAIGLGISVLFSVLGTARGVWEVLKLHPAEAMRQRPPERGGRIWLEHIPAVWRLLDFQTQLALRNVFRNRIRSVTSIVASALAVSIIFAAMVTYESFLYLVDYQFERVTHSHIDIGLRDEKSQAALLEMRRLPGIDYGEPIFGLTCDLRHGRYSRRIHLTGLSAQHRLTTPLRTDGQPITVPRNGLVLTRKLAELLHAQSGDPLDVTPVRGRRDTVRTRVASIVDSFLGLDCYADQQYLSSLVGEAGAMNAAQLLVNPAEMETLYRTIQTLPTARNLTVRADAKQSIETTLVATTVFSMGLIVLFAGVLAFGSTLNNALIEIGDRMREISTLRVLGYSPGQIAGMLFRQTVVTFAIGLALAFPLGWITVRFIATAYNTELYRMPIVIHPALVAITIVLTFVFVLIAQWLVYRQIKKLDWLEGVQVKE